MSAAPARALAVLLLRPARPSPQAAEAIVRLRGELLAAGYAVEQADVPEWGSVRTAMEPPSRPAGADAVVALFGDDPQGPGALWVIDRTTGKTVTRPIPHDAEGVRGAQILSVRALELLRASFLEAALEPATTTPARTASPPAPKPVESAVPSPTAPPPARATTAAAPTGEDAGGRDAPRAVAAKTAAGSATATATLPAVRAPARWAVEAGGLVVTSLDGVPPAVLPLLRGTVVPVARWALLARLTVAGLGTRPRATGAPGAAEVSQQLALAEALRTFRLGRRWQPFLSLGAGATHVSAQGFPVTSSPLLGRTADAWAFVADVGAGLRLALGAHLSLSGEVHAEADAPYPSVRFQGAALATEGRPTLLGSLSLLAWL